MASIVAVVSRTISYVSLLGLSTQSGRFHHEMTLQLQQMVTLLEQSSTYQLEADDSDLLSKTKSNEAIELDEEAETLRTEAAELRAKAEADQIQVAEEQTEIETTESQLAIDQTEAAAHAATAASQEVVSDNLAADGTADATEAARIEARAHGEELSVAVCELIPLVDLLCDTVGGISAIGMEAAAATEATKAASELLGSASAKATEEREAAAAAELETHVAEEQLLETNLQQDVVQTTSKEQQEQAMATQKETEANALINQATIDEDIAQQQQSQAMVDRTQSTTLAEQAVVNGVTATWNAILAACSSLISFFYFLFQFINSFVVPTMKQFVDVVVRRRRRQQSQSITNTNAQLLRQLVLRNASYCFHHIMIFGIVLCAYQNVWIHTIMTQQDNNTAVLWRARGGILLCVAVTASFIQTISLHILPNYYYLAATAKTKDVDDNNNNNNNLLCMSSAWSSSSSSLSVVLLLLHFVRRMIVLPLVFLLEMLLLWVIFGGGGGGSGSSSNSVFVRVIDALHNFQDMTSKWSVVLLLLAAIVGLTIFCASFAAHTIWLEIPFAQSQSQQISSPWYHHDHKEQRQAITDNNDDDDDHNININHNSKNEMDLLLPKSKVIKSNTVVMSDDDDDDHQNDSNLSNKLTLSSVLSANLSLLWKELSMLQPLLELLVLACLVRIMMQSWSSLKFLWPTTKTVLIHSRPDWLVPVSILLVVVLLFLCVVTIIFGRR